jgi:hypothetical protein
MSASSIVAVALKALRRNLFRTFLTMVGMAVGVAASSPSSPSAAAPKPPTEAVFVSAAGGIVIHHLNEPDSIPGMAHGHLQFHRARLIRVRGIHRHFLWLVPGSPGG